MDRPIMSGLGRALGVLSGVTGRLRDAKPLHPTGVVLRGWLLRTGTATSDVPWIDAAGEQDVMVRLSRGGGLPSWAPDVDGLAFRQTVPDGVVDVLLSTTGSSPGARHVLRPCRWGGCGSYTSLLPFRGPGGPVLLGAEPRPRRRLPADPVARGVLLEAEPLRLRLAWARPRGPWQRFGWLEIAGPVQPQPDPMIRFDPENTPPGLETYPWVRALREPAYVSARRAVGPENHHDGSAGADETRGAR